MISACHSNTSTEVAPSEYTHRIPAGENSWITHNQNLDHELITKEGIRNWKGSKPIKIYFGTTEKGMLMLGLNLKSSSEKNTIKATLNQESKEISLENDTSGDIYLGQFEVKEAGYQELILETTGENKSKNIEIKEVLVAGKAAEGEVIFVQGNFYFGRRGPSVHLRYTIPETSKKIQYFYNEIEVPQGEDVVGSYFMANGFGQGYFGMQVNSKTERRILFSVWSPYETQDPDEIPEEYRIELLKKGEGVTTGKFGNEGSGGQSYKVFDWKSGSAYKFLLKGIPNGDNSTNFTAYFYAPELGEWQLIASFRRPHTDTYLTNLYSFLENFVPATGDTSREALYKNQWVYDSEGNWTELTKAEFTTDATANADHRLDYAGGVDGNAFYMKNCGFFDDYTKMNTNLERAANGAPPNIDFDSLEK